MVRARVKQMAHECRGNEKNTAELEENGMKQKDQTQADVNMMGEKNKPQSEIRRQTSIDA